MRCPDAGPRLRSKWGSSGNISSSVFQICEGCLSQDFFEWNAASSRECPAIFILRTEGSVTGDFDFHFTIRRVDFLHAPRLYSSFRRMNPEPQRCGFREHHLCELLPVL